MVKNLFIIIFIFFLFCFTKANAGWYECYNFKGDIGGNPITLSLQIREGYFGEKTKKGYNLIGVYKYDKFNTPIRLEGTLNMSTKKVVLYELSGNKYAATIEFDFSEEAIRGQWQDIATKKRLLLQMRFVSKLDDLNKTNLYTSIDILQFKSLPDLYFMGDYSKIDGRDQAQMDKLKIIRKKDNVIIQVLDLTKVEEPTGNLMTIIFDNVEVIDAKKKTLGVSRNAGKFSEPIPVRYNLKTGKFKLEN